MVARTKKAKIVPKKDTEIELLASLCRASFWEFCREFWEEVPGAGKIITNWHMEFICNEMQVLAERVFKGEAAQYDEVYNVPPGTSKSTLLSILFHPWTWTRMPTARHLNASHTETLVLDLANKSRTVIKSEKYQMCFPEIKLNPNQDSKGYYANTLGGDRFSSTVGGKSPMGFHAHFLGGDDLLDPQKALSMAESQTAKDFVSNYLPTRMVDKSVSVMFLVMQRLGRGDPTEVMLDIGKREGARPVRLVCLPGEITDKISPPELKEKYIDGLMDPVRLSRRVLQAYRAKGDFYYAAQFLQNPIALGGGMFKEDYFIHLVKAAPYNSKRIRYWDRACLVAGTTVQTSDGLVPIEKVARGDLVLTRSGYCRVLQSGSTKRVTDLIVVLFSCGSVITGTYDHKVWVEDQGLPEKGLWVELGGLNCSHTVFWDNPKVSRGLSRCRVQSIAAKREAVGVAVYDLTVEGPPEFFANGILVHNSTEGGGCNTAGTLLGNGPDGNFYVENCVTGQWEPDKRNKIILATAQKDRRRYGPKYEPIIYVEAEGGSSGRDAWKQLARVLAGFVVKEDRPSGSKDVRAEPWACQCAAGNVFLVDDGTWDVAAYITEHINFRPEPGKRLGAWKDRVDSSTGAFNLLVSQRAAGTLYVMGGGKFKKSGLVKLVVCSKEDLAHTIIEHKCLLISIRNPLPKSEVPLLVGEGVVVNGEGTRSNLLLTMESRRDSNGNGGAGEGALLPVPEHGLELLLDTITLEFADLNPSEIQDQWSEPILEYGDLPENLVIQKDHGRALWKFLLKKRLVPPEVVVFQDEGDRRALSIAMGVCDASGLSKAQTIYCVSNPDYNSNDPPPNAHVYEMIRSSREAVLG